MSVMLAHCASQWMLTTNILELEKNQLVLKNLSCELMSLASGQLREEINLEACFFHLTALGLIKEAPR